MSAHSSINKKGSFSPFRKYRIITEEVLTPKKRQGYIQELALRGWIHPEVCRPTSRTPHRSEFTLIEVLCTPEHLGKVAGYMLEQEGWIIIEQLS